MASEFDKNLRDAAVLIERFSVEPLPHFIAGKRDSGRSGKTFNNITPVDNSVMGQVAAGNADDIDAACRAAEEAFVEWRDLPGRERKKVLHKVADGIEASARDIALVEGKQGQRAQDDDNQHGDSGPQVANPLALSLLPLALGEAGIEKGALVFSEGD